MCLPMIALRCVNCHARWAIKRQIAGKTVALLLTNCADYVAIWLGFDPRRLHGRAAQHQSAAQGADALSLYLRRAVLDHIGLCGAGE